MKNWQETSDLVSRIRAAGQRNETVALAVVIGIEGSTYRRAGAKLLVERTGASQGHISGGCLEEEVRQAALEVMQTGQPRLAHYDTSDADDVVWGLGLGCNGQVDLLIQAIAPRGPLASVLDELSGLLKGDQPLALSYRLTDGLWLLTTADGIAAGSFGSAGADQGVAAQSRVLLSEQRSGIHVVEDHRVFTEVLLPPPRLLICGAGDDAIPLVRGAMELGFRVTVADHRPAYLAEPRFPGADRIRVRAEDGVSFSLPWSRTYVVIKTHALRHDQNWLQAVLGTETPYIGLLGPRSRRDELMKGVPEEERSRVFGPVGLDLGVEGAEQVALSILAEVMAVRAQRLPGHLRDRTGPIHEE